MLEIGHYLQEKGNYDTLLCTMLTKGKKTKTIKDTQRHAADTGSPEVQIALLTRKIEELTKHLKKNLKDKHSRRGLLQMVADRKTHMNYLQKKDVRKFNSVIKKLDLKKKAA